MTSPAGEVEPDCGNPMKPMRVAILGTPVSSGNRGVFDTVGMGGGVLDGREATSEQAVARILELYRSRDAVRGDLRTRAEEAKKRLYEIFGSLFSREGEQLQGAGRNPSLGTGAALRRARALLRIRTVSAAVIHARGFQPRLPRLRRHRGFTPNYRICLSLVAEEVFDVSPPIPRSARGAVAARTRMRELSQAFRASPQRPVCSAPPNPCQDRFSTRGLLQSPHGLNG